MSEASPVSPLRTLVLALFALLAVVLCGQLVGARVGLSAAGDLEATGVAVVGGLTVLAVCLVLPLVVAGRLLGLLAKARPHRPTVSLLTLGLWNTGALALMVGLFPTRSAEALRQHGDWIPGTTGTPLTAMSTLAASTIPGASSGAAEGSPDEGLLGEVEAAGAELLDDAGDEALGEPALVQAVPPPPWTPEQLFAQRADSVVVVQTRSPLSEEHPLKKLFAGMGMEAVDGHGSGFVVDADAGLVVTNHHVINGVSEAVLRTRDGRRLGPVQVLYDDAANDLALVRVPVPEGGLVATPLAAADSEVPVGARTWAIGAPLGLEHSLTEGIVSGHRDMQGTRFIQMQTTIAPGSSGGPLFDDHGRVVGVNTATRSPGLNLAVGVAYVHALLAAERQEEAPALATLAPGYEVTRVDLEGQDLQPTSRQGLADVAEVVGRRTFSCLDTVPDGLMVTVQVPAGLGEEPRVTASVREVDLSCLEADLRMVAFPLQGAVMQGAIPADARMGLTLRREADGAEVRVLLRLGEAAEESAAAGAP